MGENRTGDFIAGFVIGGFFGAALALILAPQPGDETLSQIRERGIEIKERAADLSAEALQAVHTLEEKGTTVLEEQKSRLQEAIQEGKEVATKKKEELLTYLEDKKKPIEPKASEA